jgi:hypothetical protein
MSIYSAAEQFAAMSDEELSKCITSDVDVGNELWAERAKRTRIKEAKERERQRIEQERLVRVRQRKDALQYSDELAQEICERIASGELLTVICLDEHLPTVRRCNQWLRDHGEFAALYQSALSDRLSIFEEQLVEIADSAARDFDEVKSKGSVRRVLDPGRNQAAKLKIEVRRLHLKAGKPQKWGDSATIITKSDDAFDPAGMNAEELERQIADIEYKSRVRAA